MRFQFYHQVDGSLLNLENTYYQNAAGNQYRVTQLKYFISGIELFSGGKKKFRQAMPPFIIIAKFPENCTFLLNGVPEGSYDSLAFSLGVVPEFNYDNAFQLNYYDIDMYWPTTMGGGYHFMKFEGHWQDGNQYGGFAFHLGQNENLITVGFPILQTVTAGATNTVQLVMNINGWFEDPYLYDLTLHGGYTMGDSVQMNMLVKNGHGVFSIKTN